MNARIVPSSVWRKLTQPTFPAIPRKAFAALAVALMFGGMAALHAGAAPLSLYLPQANAFAILGRSCGGIQEQVFATGFDATNGYPTGQVYIQTRCGGSGKGGGYHTTTYSAWVGVTWDFGGNVVSAARLTTVVSGNPTFTATDAYGDEVYNTGTAAYLVVPAPAAPTGVTALQTGDQAQVSWTPNGVNPAAITASTLTATPISPAFPSVTSTVSGGAATALLGPLQPQTSYRISVTSTSIGGPGPASNPILLTTVAASVAPAAPTGVTAHWGAVGATTGTLSASWLAAVPGNSPVDAYQITISGSDGGGTHTQTVSGTTLTASFIVDFTPDWSVTVRAHNAVGWGPSWAE